MRYWQPIHFDRWRAFIAGLDLSSRGQPATITQPGAIADSQPPIAVPSPETPASSPIPSDLSHLSSQEHETATEESPQEPPQAVTMISDLEPADPVMNQLGAEALPEETPLHDADPDTGFPANVDCAADFKEAAESTIHTEVTAQDAETTPDLGERATPSSDSPVFEFRLPDPETSTARAFFSALGWLQRGRSTTSSKTASPLPHPTGVDGKHPLPASYEAHRKRFLHKASSFFQQIPWSGGSKFGEVIASLHITAQRDYTEQDPRFTSIPGDNPLMAGMLSAARTSDRIASSQSSSKRSTARAFFRSLPWKIA